MNSEGIRLLAKYQTNFRLIIQTVKTSYNMSKPRDSQQSQTPVKKWQQMSPLEEDLAIIQSQDSQEIQYELFNELVGLTPCFQDSKSQSHSSSPFQDSYSENHSESSPASEEERSQSGDAVRDMKNREEKTEEKAILRVLDTNRKGCNCRNSRCEKNYCDCLKMGLVCGPGLCSCEDCHNTEEKAIHKQNILKKVELQTQTRRCNCKKSKCLKKYCQCHSNGKKCSSLCECTECFNRDENQQPPYETIKKLRKIDHLSLQTRILS